MNTEYSALLKPVMSLAIEAGIAIMALYQHETSVALKADRTPVTAADQCADDIITAGLKKLTPDIPVLSEEGAIPSFDVRQQWKRYWLVDPLDGTREYIERTGEFCINIALIENHEPILGIIYAPVTKIGYKAYRGCGAFKYQNECYELIHTRLHSEHEVVIAISRHQNNKAQKYAEKFGKYRFLNYGSAIKTCLVAEGLADIYPRMGPTSEWDTAAGQCILEAAGGQLMDFHGNKLRYNTRPSLENPEFIAVGDSQQEWINRLTNNI